MVARLRRNHFFFSHLTTHFLSHPSKKTPPRASERCRNCRGVQAGRIRWRAAAEPLLFHGRRTAAASHSIGPAGVALTAPQPTTLQEPTSAAATSTTPSSLHPFPRSPLALKVARARLLLVPRRQEAVRERLAPTSLAPGHPQAGDFAKIQVGREQSLGRRFNLLPFSDALVAFLFRASFDPARPRARLRQRRLL